MIPESLIKKITKDDYLFAGLSSNVFLRPKYDPKKHYLDLTQKKYFKALLYLRHYIKVISDYYFSAVQDAKNIDLFMLTPSISSPMGPGSDSEAIPVKFGKFNCYLTDSAQFGFEPLIINGFDRVYCYLPSMRGENYDKRHLNQFYHCEAEIKGTLKDIKMVAEGYVKIMTEALLLMDNIIKKISRNYEATKTALNKLLEKKKFDEISFDEAVEILEKHNKKEYVNYTDKGRDIRAQGEIELMRILGITTPLWIQNFDRDRVPFYQKPDLNDSNKVINADLLFPSIIETGFGGEIIGSGQRQDNVEEMYESLKRQNLKSEPYEWYIDLRRQEGYSPTSGFGLGIERFIAWALGLNDIKDAIIYPRLKNVLTYP